MGGTLIPAMVANGYDRRYAMGVVAASGTLGILIPPSITFVLIGVTSGASIGRLFMAGVLPGLLIAAALAFVAIVMAKVKGYHSETRAAWRERWATSWQAIPGLLLPVVVLGSIYGGITTPTEAAVLSVFYALAVSTFVYREMNWSTMRIVMRETVGLTSMIFLIIPAAMTFAMYLTSEQVPQHVAEWVASHFDDARLPSAALLSGNADAWPAVRSLLDVALVMICAEMVGGAEKCLEDSVAYAKERIQFGKPIGVNQAIKHKCADMLFAVESAKSITYYAAWAARERNAQAPVSAAMAKAYVSDAFRRAAAENIQIHGGVGFTWEYDCHLFFKRARSDEAWLGDGNHHRERVATMLGV